MTSEPQENVFIAIIKKEQDVFIIKHNDYQKLQKGFSMANIIVNIHLRLDIVPMVSLNYI